MGKKAIIIAVTAIAVLVIAGVWVGLWLFSWIPNPTGPSPYTAVYMASGDIYFGKFSRFPSPRLTGVWFLQRVTGANNQQQFSVVPFKSAFWGPVDELSLNSKHILFTARLRNDSQVAKGLANPDLFQKQQTGGTNQLPQNQAPPGGNFQGPSTPPPSR